MQSSSNCYLVITEKEWREFLSETSRLRLSALFTQLIRVDPLSFKSDSDWESWLTTTQPEQLVTCWKTPRLPADPKHVGLVNLKYVCHLGGSIRKHVPRELIEAGLIVTNWGGSISRVVAECGLLLILTELRQSAHWNLTMHREGSWKDDSLDSRSLFNRKVGLHGFGGIARCLVDLLKPFGVAISAYSPSVPDTVFEAHDVARADTLEALFSENEIIVELAALTPKNYHMVNESILRLIPEGGVFVNIGRGAVVDEAALVKLAGEGRIRVALDVYENEPLPKDSPLRAIDQITLLPHLGGPTVDQRCTAGAYGVDNLERYAAGQELESIVNLWVYDLAT